MGMNVIEDLSKINNVLIQLDANILQLNEAMEHLYGKISHYRKILTGKHNFKVGAMNREIDDARLEIRSIEKTIKGEKERKKYYQDIKKVLVEKSNGDKE